MFCLTKIAVYCCVVLALSTQQSRAANYALDGSHTAVIFGISHLGFSHTYGRFNKVAGQFAFDKANPTASQFMVEIDAASIDSNDAKRDEHLRSPDFFDVRQFPTITFQSTGVSADGNQLQVTGNMTMHGVTQQVALPLTYLGEGQGPYGNYRCGFATTFTLKRSDYGMKGMLPQIGDEVAITFSFEGIQQK